MSVGSGRRGDAVPRRSRRSVLLMTAAAVAAVIVPYLVWQQTWFGRRLSDEEIERYLHMEDRPRKIQHALSQLSEQVTAGLISAKRYHPRLVELADHPAPEIRATVAWTLGQDNRSELFRSALLRLLRDTNPIVQRNAALSLVRHGDPRGRPVLRDILQPYVVQVRKSGRVSVAVEIGRSVTKGALLARISAEDRSEFDVRAPFAGTVFSVLKSDGSIVEAGDPLVEIRSSEIQIWEALRGLYLVGREEDLAVIEPFQRPKQSMPERIARQAILTAQAIRARSELNPTR